jgi:hypothetical protein
VVASRAFRCGLVPYLEGPRLLLKPAERGALVQAVARQVLRADRDHRLVGGARLQGVGGVEGRPVGARLVAYRRRDLGCRSLLEELEGIAVYGGIHALLTEGRTESLHLARI